MGIPLLAGRALAGVVERVENECRHRGEERDDDEYGRDGIAVVGEAARPAIAAMAVSVAALNGARSPVHAGAVDGS